MSDSLRETLERVTHGQYRIVRELGRGGMGAVFLAEDLSLDREVAIKVLPPELAFNSDLRERFVREGKLAASLSHPNIVHVHAVLEQDDVLAIIMQYVDGETLTQRIARSGAYDASDCARLLQDTAWALGYAHARGIVHRDVKPDNVMIERGTGRALILDFGVARKEQAATITEVGQSIGTPHYMSPEQAAAETIDGRSDLYSLGCVGFFAATGRTPFHADSAHRLLMMHMTTPAPSVIDLRPEFPRELADVIARSLAKDRADRFETGEALAEAVGELQLRSREVAPVLRLFHQQTADSFQSVITLLFAFTVIWELLPPVDAALHAIVVVLFGSIFVTILIHVLDCVRFVVRQGFTWRDVDLAFESIGDEASRAREQLTSDPFETSRLKRRRRTAAIGLALGVLSFPAAIIGFSVQENGTRTFQGFGALILFGATILIGVSLALWVMRPVRVTLAQRVAGRFWHSALGRRLFARAERRYARDIGRGDVAAPSRA